MPSSSALHSPYDALPTPASVRLLSLTRAAGGAIAGTVEIFSIDDAACPGFTTLSYVWGPPQRSHTIRLSGHDFPVLDSVYPILEAICGGGAAATDHGARAVAGSGFRAEKDRYYWIDSICINQNDAAERAAQVALMGQLYRKARRTAVWLGEANSDTDLAMDLFITLARRRMELEDRSLREGPGWLTLDETDELADPARWAAWERLLRGPWWRRVWTLQEFVVSRQLDFHCGPTKSFSRRQFQKAMFARRYCRLAGGEYGSSSDGSAWLTAWNRRRLLQWYERAQEVAKHSNDEATIGPDGLGMGLFALMAYTGDCSATEAHDRAFAVLGLACPSDVRLVDPPSYATPVEVLFTKLLQDFIEARRSLDFICFAELFGAHARHSINGPAVSTPGATVAPLPSWVPDWRAQIHTFVIPLMVSQSVSQHIGNFRPILGGERVRNAVQYRAAGPQEKMTWSISMDGRRLQCEAYILDRIDGLGAMRAHAHGDLDKRSPAVDLVQSTAAKNTSTPMSADAASAGQESGGMEARAAMARLLDAVVRCLVLDRRDRYLSQHAPGYRFRLEFLHLAALFRALATESGTALAANTANLLSTPHRCFLDWLAANGGFSVSGGVTLEDLSQTLMRALMMPENAGDGRATALASLRQVVDVASVAEQGFAARMHDTTERDRMGKRLVTTESGFLGMGPARARKGDPICIVDGCSVPIVLRERSEDEFTFIGECYVDGFMSGEIAGLGRTRRKFVLV